MGEQDETRGIDQGMCACATIQNVILTVSEGSPPAGQKERLGEMGLCLRLAPRACCFKAEWIIC